MLRAPRTMTDKHGAREPWSEQNSKQSNLGRRLRGGEELIDAVAPDWGPQPPMGQSLAVAVCCSGRNVFL